MPSTTSQLDRLARALRCDDFAYGDSFWIGDHEYEVTEIVAADGLNVIASTWKAAPALFEQGIDYGSAVDVEPFRFVCVRIRGTHDERIELE